MQTAETLHEIDIPDLLNAGTQTLEEMEEQVSLAWVTTKRLLIARYHSSRGSNTDYLVDMLGPDGYKESLEQSLEMLQKGEVDLEVEDGISVGAQAAASLSASWAKSLKGLHKPREYKHELNFEEIADKGYTLNDSDQIIIRNVRVCDAKAIESVPTKPSDKELVRAKQEIQKRTPMGSYMGQLNLSPEKCKLVKCVNHS